jgi:hypothetical protein
MTCPHCGYKANTKASIETMSELQIREIVQDEINQIDEQSEPF